MGKRHGVLLALKLIFILSLIVLIYSIFQVVKAPIEARQALNDWAKKREEVSSPPLQQDEIPLPEGMIRAPKEHPNLTSLYTEGEVIGEIRFPALDKKVAILEGTASPELKKGAGHYIGSAALGSIGNSVLAGHRDTVFRNLGELVAGDLIELESMDGIFTYKVTGSMIVDGKERNAIRPSDKAILTLITCYPFSYVGSAPDRYLLSAELVTHEAADN